MRTALAGVGLIAALGAGWGAETNGRPSSADLAQGRRGAATLPAGRASGTVTVGTFKAQILHAYAFPEQAGAEDPAEQYRLYLTNRPLPAPALKLATTAGADEGDRQELAVLLSEQKIFGVEAIVAADKRVLRVNIYSPDSVLGMMVLGASQFDATTFDAQRIAGRIAAAAPQQDPRLGKMVHYQVTFSAAVQRVSGK